MLASMPMPFPLSLSKVDIALKSLAMFMLLFMPGWLVVGRAGADIAVSVIAGAFLLHAMISRKGSYFHKTEARCLGVFWLLLILFTFLSDGSTKELLKALAYSRFLLAYLAIRYWLWTESKWLVYAAIIAAPLFAFVALDSWWQYIDGKMSLTGHLMTGHAGNRLTGPLTHPNLGNLIFKIALPMMVVWWMIAPRIKLSFAALLAALSLTLVPLIPLSGERSITVILLLSLGIFFALALWRLPVYRKQLLFLLLLMLSSLPLLAAQDVIIERLNFMIEQLGEFGDTPYGQLWQMTAMYIASHPLFGIGHTDFLTLCNTYKASGQISYCDVHSHNFYLQLWLTTGLLGLITILSMILFVCWRAWREMLKQRGDRAVVYIARLALLAAFFFPLAVTQDIYSNWPASLFWYTLALILSLKHVAAYRE